MAQSIGLSEVRFDGDEIYWLESRPQEGGRSVVVRYVAWNSTSEDITPSGFNVRTRVHEYGGGAWTVDGGMIYFSNHADNRLYRMDRYGHQPLPLTPEGPWRYADGLIDSRHHSWIGVREDHSADGQPVNTIVRIDVSGTSDSTGSGTVLASGHDFYSSPRLSPDGRWLAFLAWDHPNMPWMGTGLYVLQLNQPGSAPGNAQPLLIAGGERESVFQPEWAPDGSALYFVSDRSGWWNLYRQKSRTPTEPLAVDGSRVRPSRNGSSECRPMPLPDLGVWCALTSRKDSGISARSTSHPENSRLSTCHGRTSLLCARTRTASCFAPVPRLRPRQLPA